ncbi:MAG: single-stranded DNA-binding protein [Acidovorax defluvii]
MNHITIAGRIGKDPEMRYLKDGDPVLSFSVADDQGKDKPTTWWPCSLFGKRAESLQQYLTKGASITVTGTVQEREYTDKDGNQRKAMQVRVGDIALQGGRQDAKPEGQAKPQKPAKPAAQSSGFEDMEDDMPF